MMSSFLLHCFLVVFQYCSPVGDDKWYLRPNPDGTPVPIVDIGECKPVTEKRRLIVHVGEGDAQPGADEEIDVPVGVSCTKHNLSTLSPTLESVRSGSDLFERYKRVVETHPKTRRSGSIAQAAGTPRAKRVPSSSPQDQSYKSKKKRPIFGFDL
jgi:hypothetical protein